MCDPVTRLDEAVNKSYLSQISDAQFILEDKYGADISVSLADVRGVLSAIQKKDMAAVEDAETILALRHFCIEAQAETDRLRAALSFYADPKTWQVNGHAQIDADARPIVRDGGKVARDALGGV